MLVHALGLLLLHSVYATCPPGSLYDSNFNKCYQYVNQALPYLKAEEYCFASGGHLVSVQSAFENSYVGQWIMAETWIGLNYLNSPYWSWTGGANVTWTNWAMNQPYDPSIYQCGAVVAGSNLWSKELCSDKNPFICEFSANYTYPTTAAPCPTLAPTPQVGCGNAACPKGYSMFIGNCRCYKFSNARRTFQDSQSWCANDKATLVKIDSADLNAFLFALMGQGGSPVGSPWLSLLCPTNVKSDCYWYDGSHLTGYSNFVSGTPSGSSFEICMSYLTARWEGCVSQFGTSTTFCEKSSTIVAVLAEEEEGQKEHRLP